MTAVTSIAVHGWRGDDAIIQTTGMPIANTSPATRLNTYAPIQNSDDSPRSNASPHVGQASPILNQVRMMPLPPHRGHRSRIARPNFACVELFGIPRPYGVFEGNAGISAR